MSTCTLQMFTNYPYFAVCRYIEHNLIPKSVFACQFKKKKQVDLMQKLSQFIEI